MSDRLYIVNTDTKEYCTIAKDFGYGYSLGNIDLLKEFIEGTFASSENLILVSECQNELWEKYIKDGININTENKWKPLD